MAATLLWSYSYKKSIINHTTKKQNKGFQVKKKNHKKLVQSQRAKKLGRFEIKLDNAWIANNKQMFAVKLLTNLVLASDCYIVLNMFEHVFTFHISYITWCKNYHHSHKKYVIIDYC